MKKVSVTSLKNTEKETEVIELEQKSEKLSLNGEIFEGDWLKLEEHRFHLVWNNLSSKVEVIEANYQKKVFKLRIDNGIYEVKVQDRLDLLLEELGMDNALDTKVNNIKAPMPGLILSINIEVGQEVSKDDPLLVLEAMKMENVLKSPTDGKIKAIQVKKGDSVEKNQLLIDFE